MSEDGNKVVVYPAPQGAVENKDFKVRIRSEGGKWQDLFTYLVKVDMHNVREASMAYFDFSGSVEIEVTKLKGNMDSVLIRPQSYNIPYTCKNNKVCFKLDRPRKISFETNGDRYHNLHIFANEIEENIPDPKSKDVVYVQPGTNEPVEILQKVSKNVDGAEPNIIYFAPGIHYVTGTLLKIPSEKTVYIAGGAIIMGAMVCDRVEDVTVRGRGILYMADMAKETYFRGVTITNSKNIHVEGISVVDPPHYSIYLGQSQNISIKNYKAFTTRGWCDGIDAMSCSDMVIDDVFLRTSDDSIAIYGARERNFGDSRNVKVMNSVLWADVAHPLMIGVHGDARHEGNLIENINYDNIDILEHHEPQLNYLGCMAINVGDKNYVRNVTYENIRVEQFEYGRLFDLRVFFNEKYNPAPGRRIENVLFKNISYNGVGELPSQIMGYDSERIVDGVTIEDLKINGKHILDPESGNIVIGDFVKNVTFK